MRKISLLLMALAPMLVNAESRLSTEQPTFDEVMIIADKAGRRTCFEIFNYGAHLLLPSGEYALDIDGTSPKEAFFGICDAVTGKTQLVSLQGHSTLPLLGEGSLDNVFEMGQGISIKTEYQDDATAITYFHDEANDDGLVVLRIPLQTEEVEVRGLVSGSVSIRRQLDGEVLSGSSKRHEFGDRIIFEVDGVDGWELVFELTDGRLEFDDVWIK